MRPALLRLAGLLLLSCAASNSAFAATIGLARAELVEVRDVSPPLAPGEVRIDGEVRLSFRVVKVLAGTVTQKMIVHTQWTAMPLRDSMYILVGEEGRKARILWWEPTRYGLCFDLEEARSYGLQNEVRRLQLSHPCQRKG